MTTARADVVITGVGVVTAAITGDIPSESRREPAHWGTATVE